MIKYKNNSIAGITFIELMVVVAIIGILSAIAVPSYFGYLQKATRSEAYANLEALKLLEEQLFAETAAYTAPAAANCAADQNNIAAIQGVLPGFNPDTGLDFSYCIQNNIDINAAVQTPCFRARAFGNAGTRVAGDVFMIDCNNAKNY